MFSNKINSWIEGFKPPSKCPACKRVYTLVFTGRRDQNNNHVYKCTSCNNLIGAPTDYAECKLIDVPLEKDIFYTPCINCPNRQIDQTHGVCIYFSKEPINELKTADQIAETIRKFTKFRSLPDEV